MSTKSITLQTNDTVVTSGEQLGLLSFAASNESDGSAALLIAAQIYAQAEGTFTATQNPTSLILATSASDALSASPKIKITDSGHILPFIDDVFDLGDTNLKFRTGYFSDGVVLEEATPGDTADKLYQNGGSLFFDGSAVGGGAGDVTKVGTPVDNEIGVWTGDGTLEGDSLFTFDGTVMQMGITSEIQLSAEYTDASNYSRGFMRMAAGAHMRIGVERQGTGTAGDIDFYRNGAIQLRLGGSTTFYSSVVQPFGISVNLGGTSTYWDNCYFNNVFVLGDIDVTGVVTVADDVYAAGWNGNLEVPTKNAIYDKIETIGGSSAATSGIITENSTHILDPAGSGEISELTIGRTLKSSIYDMPREDAGTTNVNIDFDLTNMNGFTISGDATVTFSGVDVGQRFCVRITQDNTGGRAITWPTEIRWPGQLEPTLSQASGQLDVFGFTCTASGVNWDDRDYDGYIIGYNLASG